MSGSSQDNWDQHWEQFAQSAELGPTPRYRRRIVRSLFDFRPPGESVRFLEIGSGTGEFAKEFCESFPAADYLGLELSQTGVSISRQRVPQAQFLQRDLLKDAAQSDRIDYGATHGLCSEVLEHVERWNLHRGVHLSEFTDRELDRVILPLLGNGASPKLPAHRLP